MGPKKQGFWLQIDCGQMKLPNFESPSGDSLSKIGRHFSNKVYIEGKSNRLKVDCIEVSSGNIAC